MKQVNININPARNYTGCFIRLKQKLFFYRELVFDFKIDCIVPNFNIGIPLIK